MKTRVWFSNSPSPKSVKLPKHLDARLRLTTEQIKEIKALYAEGQTSRAIAAKFDVSKTTVLNHVNPQAREKANKRARERNQYKWANDDKWKNRKRASNRKSFKRKKRLLPEFRRTVHEYEWRRRARKVGITNQQQQIV